MSAPRFQVLDVRPILDEGTEPFPVIRQTIDALQPGEGLTVIAPFLPAPLIEKFKSEGFQVRLERVAEGGWSVDFWRD